MGRILVVIAIAAGFALAGCGEKEGMAAAAKPEASVPAKTASVPDKAAGQEIASASENRSDDLVPKNVPSNVAGIIKQYYDSFFLCRGDADGGESDDWEAACKKRDALYSRIKQEGWCLGPESDSWAEGNWVKCSSQDSPTNVAAAEADAAPPKNMPPVYPGNSDYANEALAKYYDRIHYDSMETKQIVESIVIDCGPILGNDGRYIPFVNALMRSIDSSDKIGLNQHAYIKSASGEARIFYVATNKYGEIIQNKLVYEINKWGELRTYIMVNNRPVSIKNLCFDVPDEPRFYIIPDKH